jgi:NAD(P)-dependent dehydrogenase (short-subunit alcohol dehydrogenase family)
MKLAGFSALVTTSRRLGAALALAFMRCGANVTVCYFRSQIDAEALVAKATHFGVQAAAVRADLTSREGCRIAVEQAAGLAGRLDVLVNVASHYERTPFGRITDEIWNRPLALDLGGTWWCSHAAVPWLKRSPHPRIVNFADWVAASHRPRYKGYLPYYVAKSSVIALTEALALELAEFGILVNCIAPGPVLPPEHVGEPMIRAIARSTPLGRWGGADAVVQAVLALVASDFTTGETVRVDGGRHLR